MNLIKMRRFDGHAVDVHPAMVDDYKSGGYSVIEDAGKIELGTDSGDQFSDSQLRGAIKEATGKAPAPRMSRDKLIAMFNEINAGE